ncbi:MAG: glucodextranase DOMON-like domain-containing protein, partial [Gammaproteobacteria bacterium]
MFDLSRVLLCLLLGVGLVSASTSASAARDIFVLDDPRGDDFGAGDLVYPNSGLIERGTLDLVSLRAYEEKDGTWFRARMGKRIASPKGLTTYIGKEPLDNLARHGFFTFNIDIYIDQDRVAGSGRIDTLPGRKVEVAREDAWEKTVVLTPRPEVARAYYKVHLEKEAEDALRAEFGKVTRDQLGEAEDRVEAKLNEEFLFPNKIRVRGSREIEFFVPDSFLGGRASPDWAYSVFVTGCEVEQLSKVVNLTPGEFSLMVVPAAFGRHQDRFGIVNDGDINQPPVIDVLAFSVAEQQRALSDYNVVEQRLAAVPG